MCQSVLDQAALSSCFKLFLDNATSDTNIESFDGTTGTHARVADLPTYLKLVRLHVGVYVQVADLW